MINGFASAETVEKKIWGFIEAKGYHEQYGLMSEVHLSLDAVRFCEVFINMSERAKEPDLATQERILTEIATELGDDFYVPFFARGFEQDARIPNILTPAFSKLNPGLHTAILQRYLDAGIPDPFPEYKPDFPNPTGIATPAC